jgi:hypothetical protein
MSYLILLSFLYLIQSGQQSDFDYISVRNQTVKTHHGLELSLTLTDSYVNLGEFDYIQLVDHASFKTSTVTYTNDSSLVVIFAEERIDGDKTFNYPELALDTVSSRVCYFRSGCFNLMDEMQDEKNKYVQYLYDKEFNMNTTLYLVQFILLNENQTAEAVLSYGKFIGSCSSFPLETKHQKVVTQAKNLFANIIFDE